MSRLLSLGKYIGSVKSDNKASIVLHVTMSSQQFMWRIHWHVNPPRHDTRRGYLILLGNGCWDMIHDCVEIQEGIHETHILLGIIVSDMVFSGYCNRGIWLSGDK